MHGLSRFFVRAFERVLPDAYVLAIVLTLLTALLAAIFAPHRSFADVAGAWYKGIFDIFAFALQMILILVTGYALASSPPVERILRALAARAQTPRQALLITFFVSALACWLNWGFGLVVAGLLARSIAGRIRIDFGWLVAAAYAGFLIWASGLSSSIALAQASHGNKLNIVESVTGHLLPLSQTIFTAFNLVPVLVLLAIVPLLFLAFEPKGTDVLAVGDTALRQAERDATMAARDTEVAGLGFAGALNRAWWLTAVLVVAGFSYLVMTWLRAGFSLDINSVIFMFFLLGMALHGKPIAYVAAVNDAAKITGPLLVQYPLYGGIMGIMTGTGLAGVISEAFITFSTAATLPFWNFVSSVIISLFVPSGGGHWAVQGPFAVPAAAKLGASQGATAMAVAMGEQVANMVQPFWCLPILAIAGIGLQRVMAYTVLVFFAAFAVFGASLLLLR